jgi:hypothetical protein
MSGSYWFVSREKRFVSAWRIEFGAAGFRTTDLFDPIVPMLDSVSEEKRFVLQILVGPRQIEFSCLVTVWLADLSKLETVVSAEAARAASPKRANAANVKWHRQGTWPFCEVQGLIILTPAISLCGIKRANHVPIAGMLEP